MEVYFEFVGLGGHFLWGGGGGGWGGVGLGCILGG